MYTWTVLTLTAYTLSPRPFSGEAVRVAVECEWVSERSMLGVADESRKACLATVGADSADLSVERSGPTVWAYATVPHVRVTTVYSAIRETA